jgi:hypothetical protein
MVLGDGWFPRKTQGFEPSAGSELITLASTGSRFWWEEQQSGVLEDLFSNLFMAMN